jgi:hypothetical protein
MRNTQQLHQKDVTALAFLYQNCLKCLLFQNPLTRYNSKAFCEEWMEVKNICISAYWILRNTWTIPQQHRLLGLQDSSGLWVDKLARREELLQGSEGNVWEIGSMGISASLVHNFFMAWRMCEPPPPPPQPLPICGLIITQ